MRKVSGIKLDGRRCSGRMRREKMNKERKFVYVCMCVWCVHTSLSVLETRGDMTTIFDIPKAQSCINCSLPLYT